MAHDDRDPLDAYLADDPLPLPPIGPDGGFMPGPHIEPEPLPEATPENMICLRRCRHYVELVSRFVTGNTRGTLAHEPRKINRFCRATGGDAIELTDETVHECSEWDPLDDADVEEREMRRRAYLAKNPLVQVRSTRD